MFMTVAEKRILVAAGRGSELPPWEGPRFHTAGSYHHQIAANVAQDANEGATLIDAIERWCDPDSPVISHTPIDVLRYLRGLDDDAEDEIEAAKFVCDPANAF